MNKPKNDHDFSAACESLGICPDHPYAAQLLEAALEEAQFALADAFTDLCDPLDEYQA